MRLVGKREVNINANSVQSDQVINFDYTLSDSTSVSTVWMDGGFSDFDGEGVFDCMTGLDTCQITVQELSP